jgi:hydroxymethylpyrimidine pyrophosphatase-like HAD family hydrolase
MRNQIDAVYVFDLDGVITNPQDSSVNTTVVDTIYDMLSGGVHVAVNTGRSYDWVEKNLVGTLKQRSNDEIFSRLYVVCEKGGESRVWQDGEFRSQPSRFALDHEAYDVTKRVFEEHKAELDTMFWDATKQTMATIEKEPASDLSEFRSQQTLLVDRLEEALGEADVKVDPTTIATDVESPRAGKHAGAELIYEWVAQNTPVEGDVFTCFGDSVSDYEMARYFAAQGAKTMFVFVGKPEDALDEDARVETIRTEAQYDAGTEEYFKTLHIN